MTDLERADLQRFAAARREAVEQAKDDIAQLKGDIEEWRGKLAEQCGKTLAAYEVQEQGRAKIAAILKRVAGPYNDQLFVGRNYSLGDLERDLYVLLPPPPKSEV